METSKKNYRIERGDSFKLIKTLPDNSLDLVVTSPPYNIGKSYEKRQALESYLEPYKEFAEQLYRTLKPGGNVAWQVGNYLEKGRVFPLDIYFYQIFSDAGFILRNRIVWHFRHGVHNADRFSGRYETILWFAKSTQSTFNLDPVRIPALYPGKRATRGPKKGLPSGNPLGKNPSDFWPDIALEEWELGIWDIPNVKAHHPEKLPLHPCQFPVELVDRLLLSLSNKGETVLDPFMGVGSSWISCERNSRQFIGFEFDAAFITAAKSRHKQLLAGKLKVREPGTPIKVPAGKMAEIPPEWKEK